MKDDPTTGEKTPESISFENFRTHTDLRIQFARAVSRVKEIPFAEALYAYTDMYRRLNLGAPPKIETERNPVWGEFVQRIGNGDSIAEAAWYLRKKTIPPPENSSVVEHAEQFGPFRYDYYAPEQAIQLHFGTFNTVTPLERPTEMRAGLIRLLEHAKLHHPDARVVFGRSWLYGRLLGDTKLLPVVETLFPKAFIDSASASPGKFQGGGRWHQFRAKDGSVNKLRARQFLEALDTLDPQNLEAAFPIQPLRLVSPVEDFYEHLGMSK